MKLKGFSLFKEKPKKAKGDFYTTRYWKQVRKYYLSMNPLCVMCENEGITKVANTVDHVVPRSQGGSDLPNNLQSLCYEHHQKKSAVEGKEAMFNNNPKWIKE